MRLWTIAPDYLDPSGLVAAWREGLLAQKVLEGATKGYAHHPQLDRFRSASDPLAFICRYLAALADEADARGYRFDRSRLRHRDPVCREVIFVGEGQIRYELELLLWKLERRSPERALAMGAAVAPATLRDGIRLNPAFASRLGGIEGWERPIPEVLARCSPL
jgi:hypothetical protein